MNQQDIIQDIHSGLSFVREWIEKLLEDNKEQAIPVISLNFPRLQKVFASDLLEKAKVVVVTGQVPFPPLPPALSSLGLPDFAQMGNASVAGVTYKDTFFVNNLHQTESIYFHELVHVVQWERLGVDNFLLAYVAGLLQFGYQDSPLEQMAYSMQEDFENDRLPYDIIDLIQQRTDAVWADVASLFSGDFIANYNIL